MITFYYFCFKVIYSNKKKTKDIRRKAISQTYIFCFGNTLSNLRKETTLSNLQSF